MVRGLAVVLVIGGSFSAAGCGRVGYEAAGLSHQDGGLDAGDGAPRAADAGTRPDRCGDGVVTGGEECDDGNGVSGDGCEAGCTYSCSVDSACDDGESCNGVETCDLESHACAAGTPAVDGTPCGSMVCRAGTCAPIGCGDGVTMGSEECDDGNEASGDGCENDCTFSCEVDADCADGSLCNGMERCVLGESLCVSGAPAPDGTRCDRDGSSSTPDWCVEGDCRLTYCGDRLVDPDAGEACDDGNETNGDGCENDCTVTPAGVDAGTADAGMAPVDGGVSTSDSGGGGETCGTRTCSASQYCCNPTCSQCVAMGMSCTAMVCRDGGPIPVDTCTTDRDCMGMGLPSTGYCLFPDGLCGGLGSCSTTGVMCPEPLPGEEVCACNAVTFPSPCEARRVGESIAYSGPC